jgi:hypothetical protein
MMKIKKLLLCFSALSGLMAADVIMAVPVGSDATITTAKVVCMSTLEGDVVLTTVAGAGQQKGIESSWLVTNTSTTDDVAITQVDSYDINGKLLTRFTPTSTAKPSFGIPAGNQLPKLTNGLFDWTVKPNQVVRFPHDYSIIYPDAATGREGTNPSLVHWHSVVLTLGNATRPGMAISAPVVVSAMVERGNYTVPGAAPVLTRTRNECAYMM